MTLPQQKSRGERSRPQKFSRWLAAQAARDDAIGHLAVETLSGAEHHGVSHETYLTRLNIAEIDVPQARDVLFEAIAEWGGSRLSDEPAPERERCAAKARGRPTPSPWSS